MRIPMMISAQSSTMNSRAAIFTHRPQTAKSGRSNWRRRLDKPRSSTPEPYVVMHAAGAKAEEVYRRAKSDGFKDIDCAFIVAGLFGLGFRQTRQIGVALRHEAAAPQ